MKPCYSKVIFKEKLEIHKEENKDVQDSRQLIVEYQLWDQKEDETGEQTVLENFIEDINFNVELEYTSNSSKKKKWNDIVVEPKEKEIVNLRTESGQLNTSRYIGSIVSLYTIRIEEIKD